MKAIAAWFCIVLFFVSCAGNSKLEEENGSLSVVSQPPRIENAAKEKILEDLKEAKTTNEDAEAWLQVPGTEINGPVMLAADNEYYLRRDLYKEKNIWGSYFFDYRTDLDEDFTDKVTVVFGHSLGGSSDEQHFSQLKRYSDIAFIENNPYFIVAVGNNIYVAEVFAAGLVSAYTNYLAADPSELEFENTIKALRLASAQQFPAVEVNYSDKIIFLSTCAPGEAIRYVVGAKLIQEAS